jgi:hypothetical protein
VASPAKIRYLGLAAAVLLAVVARLGGALPHGDLAGNPITIARGPHGPIILTGWAVGTAFQAYAWWTARDRTDLTARWVLVTSALWVLPFLVVPPYGSRDVYATWPLALLAAVILRNKLMMAVSIAGPLLVLPDGSGLARFIKFPGAPLMTAVLVVVLLRVGPFARTQHKPVSVGVAHADPPPVPVRPLVDPGAAGRLQPAEQGVVDRLA